ncbi:hypothetical protein Tco_1139625, partial [Tanacetum coccineum]
EAKLGIPDLAKFRARNRRDSRWDVRRWGWRNLTRRGREGNGGAAILKGPYKREGGYFN